MATFATKQNLSLVATLLAASIGAATGGLHAASAPEPQRLSIAPASRYATASVADLEKAFWVCDYLATTEGIGDPLTCSLVSEALKERRFSGDLDSLLSWWRQNKVAQHRKVAAGRAARAEESRHE